MYNPQPGYGPPPPYGPPPQRAPFVISGQVVGIAFGVVALVGLLCTLLPMWTLDVNAADFETSSSEAGVEVVNGLVKIHVGFYDWIISAAPVLALIPLALAASVAIRPSSAAEVSGPLAQKLKPRDLPLNQASGVDVGYGPGLIIALIALVAVCGIAAWQYVAAKDSEAVSP